MPCATRRHPAARRARRARDRRREATSRVFRTADDRVFALPTAARTRAGRCRRASSSATASHARCTTGRSSCATGCAVAPDEGCARTLPGARSSDGDRRIRRDRGAGRVADRRGDALHLPLLRRRLRRHHRARRRRRSPACAAIPIIRPIAASSARKGRSLHLTATPRRDGHARAHPLRARGDAARRAQRVAGTRRSTTLADRFARCIARARPGQRRVLHFGAAPHRGLLRLQQAREGPDRHQQRRHQLAAVHVERGRGLQGRRSARTRRPPATTTSTTRDCLFIAGSNTAWAHPVLFRRIEAREGARSRDASIIVVDPRRTATARGADLHLAIEPGTDVALFHGDAAPAAVGGARRPRVHRARTPSGSTTLKRDRARIHAARGRRSLRHRGRDIVTAARWFADARATLSLYCQGSTSPSRGTAKNAALINLHLATGQIGKPGAGPFSLTGQPNAMGGREVGGMANLLSAHRDLADPAHRAEVARALGRRRRSRRQPGLDRGRALRRARRRASEDGVDRVHESRAVDAGPGDVRAALARAELVVLQEALARHRDRALRRRAAARGDLGREGRHGHQLRAPHLARARRRRAARRSARRLGDRRRLRAPARSAAAPGTRRRCSRTTSPDASLRRARETTRGRDLDITGLSYATLDAHGPQQWPYPRRRAQGTRAALRPTAFSRRRTAARASPRCRIAPVAERADARYPLRLTTGRLRDQWHGMSRTGTVAPLFGMRPSRALRAASRRPARARARRRRSGRASSRGAARSSCRSQPSDELRPGQRVPADALGHALRSAGARQRRRQRAHAKAACPRFAASRSSSTRRCGS